MQTNEDLALALHVLEYPAPDLNRRATHVFDFGELEATVKAMRITALLNQASFLAATQVKILQRIIFVPSAGYAFINPNIIEQDKSQAMTRIRCVSFPNQIFSIQRAQRIKIQAQDVHGNRMLQDLDGLAAIQTQVAIEYLNGKTLASELTWQEKLNIFWKLLKNNKKSKHNQVMQIDSKV